MYELLAFIQNELRGAWRFRWTAVACAWAICALGWLVVYSLPNIYEARAQVYVDAESRLAEVMGQVGVSPGVGSRVFVVRQAMLGRPQLERVAAETGFDQRARNEEEEETLYEGLRDNIEVTTGRTSQSSNLYTISFEDSDRRMALEVVQTLLDTFVEDVLKLKELGTDEVDSYLADQLAHYSGLLQDAERNLAEFKKKYVGLLPGESGGVFEKLQSEMNFLSQAELELNIEQDRRNELRRQLQSEAPLLPPSAEDADGDRPVGGRTSIRIEDMERQLSELLLAYTDRHPDVLAAREQLDQMYAQELAERNQMISSGAGMEGAANATNPVYQTAQIALNESSVLIAGLTSQVMQYRASVQYLRTQSNTIPEIEAELAALTRNYDQYRDLYNEIMIRKERERMGKVGTETDVVSFNITEPPTAALEPVGPKRNILLVGVMILGLGAGGVVAFLMSQMKPVFHDIDGLRSFLDRPVLGQVSMAMSAIRAREKRRDVLLFATAMSALVICFVAILVLQTPGVEFVRSALGQVGA